MTQLSLSMDEAAATAGVGKTKLYEVINTGALRARKWGKRTIILQSDLEAFLANLENYVPTAGETK